MLTPKNSKRISLVPHKVAQQMPHKVAQQMPQLAYVTSCGWWRDAPTWTRHHPSTNHNSPHGRVVAFVVPFYVALDGLCKRYLDLAS